MNRPQPGPRSHDLLASEARTSWEPTRLTTLFCRQNARIIETFSVCRIDQGKSALHLEFTISLLIALLALVSVFIEIPFVSNYAFWVLLGAYLLLAGRK
jgi:hypothetical protein